MAALAGKEAKKCMGFFLARHTSASRKTLSSVRKKIRGNGYLTN